MKAVLLAIAAIAYAVPLAAAPKAHHAAVPDWVHVATATPEGGVRIGNPAAKVRLVEYGSFTCPHCGALARDGFATLRDRYVRSGRLSFEFRPALRDGADMLAALTATCGGPQPFFPIAEALYARQEAWLDAVADWAQAHQAETATGDAALPALAEASGLAKIAGDNGIAPQRYRQCLTDPAAKARLAKAAGDAWDVRKIGGTPALYLNDEKLDAVYGWAALEPRLKAAVAG